MRKFLFIVLYALAACTLRLNADDRPGLIPPLHLEGILAGNFGELRPNHFHSGVDFKTGGRTGASVRSVADGYVSRALCSPWGFGRAVYVVHPELGLTTVYGHLESFNSEIDRRVRSRQAEEETFAIDIEFQPGEIPVKAGDEIAKSGNAGSSFGPHLHFDVRDTATGDALDPLEWLGRTVKDHTAPEIRHIGLYPVEGEGTVTSPAVFTPQSKHQEFTAWGKVIPAVNAFDRMDGTHNIYGVKHMRVKLDGKQIYTRRIDRFSFDATRAVNTLARYADVIGSGRWMMTTYVPATAPLGNMITAENRGIITIDEERPYMLEFELEDHFGNVTRKKVKINGKKAVVPAKKARGFLLDPKGEHGFRKDGVKVTIPRGAAYDDMDFNVELSENEKYFSPVAKIGDETVPLAGTIDIELPVNAAADADMSKFLIVRLGKNGSASAIDSYYSDGKMHAKVNRFGTYAVSRDVTPPKIIPIAKERWGRNGIVKLKITDNLAGIENYNGEIDGKFVIFELDGKSATASYRLNPKEVARGNKHKLSFLVLDGTGNRTVEETEFVW